MFYGDKTAQDNEIMKRVEAGRAAAAAFPYLRKVLERFDGKVLNCRLENALREDGNWWSVELKGDDNHGRTLYISFCSEKYRWKHEKTVVRVDLGRTTDKDPKWDGKRIPAALLIESAKGYREKHLRESAELESIISKVPELNQQILYFKSQIDKIVSSIPYEARDIYNLGYYVTKS